jgi:glucose/mannose transport system substrate-binding protein
MKVIGGDKSQQVPAVELLSSPAMTGALEDVYSQFWNTPNASVDQFIEKIVGVLKQEL